MKDSIKITDELHRWAFEELVHGNESLAWRIIRIVTKRKMKEKTWLESYEGGK